MKLAILEISKCDASIVRRWARDPDCLSLAVNRPGDCEWRRAPVEMTPYEAIAQRHVELCQPLFEAGARNDGPSLPGATVSFVGAADFTLFIESRFPTALLLDLERLARDYRVDHLEYVTDMADGAKYRAAAQAFAAAHQLPLRCVSLARVPRGFARNVSRAIDASVGSLWSHGPAYLDAGRARLRRWLHGRRAESRPSSGPIARHATDGHVRAAMLVYHPKSWRYLLPIRKALLAAGHEVLLISPRLECDRALEAAGVEFVSLPTSLPRVSLRSAVAEYLRQLPWTSDDADLNDLVRENGALRRLTVRSALAASSVYGHVATTLPALLKQHRINVVLGTDWGSVAGRCFYRSAVGMGAEAVFVQHGSLGVLAGAREYMLESYRLLWGENSCHALADHGLARPERTLSFGSPFHEERYGFAEGSAECRAAARRTVLVTFGVPGGYISEGAFRLAATAVLQTATQFADANFLVKPHPGDPGVVWRQLMAEYPNVNVTLASGDTYDLMRQCDVLVTMFSTTGSEAICMGKAVVSVNPEDRQAREEYLTSGAAYSVRDAVGLGEVLQELFAAPPGKDRLADVRRGHAEQFFHREQRSAALRTVDFLEGLVPRPVAGRLLGESAAH